MKKGKNTRALIFAVLALVFLIASFELPWWGVHTEVTTEVEGESTTEESSYLTTVQTPFGSVHMGDSRARALMAACLMMLYITLALVLIAITLTFLFILGGQGTFRRLRLISISAVVLSLIIPITFMALLPPALRADDADGDGFFGGLSMNPEANDPTKMFFGGHENVDESDGTKVTTNRLWGPDAGWFTLFGAFAMLLLSAIYLGPRGEISGNEGAGREEEALKGFAAGTRGADGRRGEAEPAGDGPTEDDLEMMWELPDEKEIMRE